MVTEDSQDIAIVVTSGTTSITMNFTALSNGFINRFQLGSADSSYNTGTLAIKQDGTTLASRDVASWRYNSAPEVTFIESDYSSLISSTTAGGAFQIIYTRTGGSGNYGLKNYSGENLTHFSYSTQDMIARHSSQPSVPLFTFTVIEPIGTNMQINITDAWKSVDAMQINIGDVWKEVVGAQVNIGDVWKTIF